MAFDLESLLTGAGFSKTQAKVYLAGLELGSATLTEIAVRAKTSKTSTYEALEELRQRKLLRATQRGKRYVYRVADPEHIVSSLRANVSEQSLMIDDIVRAMPVFTSLQGGIKPSVTIHEGADAAYAYFEHIDRIKPESMDEITNVDDVYSWVTPETLLHARKMYPWIPKTARILRTGDSRNPRKGFEMRIPSKAWGTFHGDIAIYGNHVAMITYTTTPTVIIIESEPLAESLRLLFNVAWRASNDDTQKIEAKKKTRR